jgi:hypothetical protein
MATMDSSTANNWVGRVGAGLSIACAIHCLLMPLLVGVLPLVGMGFLADEATEAWIIGAVVVTAVAGGLWGFRLHGSLRVLMTLIGAVGLVMVGQLLGHAHALGEALTIGGMCLVAVGHLVSVRLCRTCDSHSGCSH